MNKVLWFKAKQYGWGWYPATWQGWLITLAAIACMAWNAYRIDSHSHSVSDTLLNVIPQTFVIAAILVLICYLTGEKPRWRWGNKE